MTVVLPFSTASRQVSSSWSISWRLSCFGTLGVPACPVTAPALTASPSARAGNMASVSPRAVRRRVGFQGLVVAPGIGVSDTRLEHACRSIGLSSSSCRLRFTLIQNQLRRTHLWPAACFDLASASNESKQVLHAALAHFLIEPTHRVLLEVLR